MVWSAEATARTPIGSALPVPDPAVLRRLYVTEGFSIAVIAERLAVSAGAVRAALDAEGISVSRPGWIASQPPPPLSESRLRELYVEQQMSTPAGGRGAGMHAGQSQGRAQTPRHDHRLSAASDTPVAD